MKPLTVESLTPERAEIRDLRRSVFLLAKDVAAALHSRAFWRARYRGAEVEIASLQAENEALRIEIERRKEDEQALAQRVEELEAENEELRARLVPSPKKARKR